MRELVGWRKKSASVDFLYRWIKIEWPPYFWSGLPLLAVNLRLASLLRVWRSCQASPLSPSDIDSLSPASPLFYRHRFHFQVLKRPCPLKSFCTPVLSFLSKMHESISTLYTREAWVFNTLTSKSFLMKPMLLENKSYATWVAHPHHETLSSGGQLT